MHTDDPEDKIPESWDSRATIPDPTATKPDDWDESQPATIPDPNAKKPEGWIEDEPDSVRDPSAVKPADWDDEEDGDFEAPLIPNPKCSVGCGAWSPPRIKNPLHKGKWHAPMINNPAYQGVWAPKKIPNPNYFLDNKPSDMAPITGLAVEVWTTNSGIHFDNFIVATTQDEAFKFAEATFSPKSKLEKAKEKEAKRKAKEEGDKNTIAEKGWLGYFEVYVVDFVRENAVAVAVSGFLVVISIVYLAIFTGSKSTGEVAGNNDEEEERAMAYAEIPNKMANTSSSASLSSEEHESSESSPATKSAPKSNDEDHEQE